MSSKNCPFCSCQIKASSKPQLKRVCCSLNKRPILCISTEWKKGVSHTQLCACCFLFSARLTESLAEIRRRVKFELANTQWKSGRAASFPSLYNILWTADTHSGQPARHSIIASAADSETNNSITQRGTTKQAESGILLSKKKGRRWAE